MNGGTSFWKRFASNRAAVGGAVLLAFVILVAVFGPIIYPVDPFDMVGRPQQPPFGRFPLGTDVAGRDMLAGLLNGARVSLLIGVMATLAATIVGVTLGAIGGYYGGWIDNILMRVTEFFLTIPSFVFAVVLVAVFSPNVVTITIAIAIVSWPSVARMTRGEFMAHRNREYVLAARAHGARDRNIIFFQILPNALPPIVVVSSLMVATAILTESGLSFLGLGDPNLVSWGYMIGVARTVLRTAWWMAAIPGVTILVTVLAINLVGEGLNDALNPRLWRR